MLAGHFLPRGLALVAAERNRAALDLGREQNAPAIGRHLHIAELRPAGGIDADGGAQIDLRLLEADRAHAGPPVEIFRPPALERALKLLVGAESDIVGNDFVVADLDETVGGDGACGVANGVFSAHGFLCSKFAVGFQMQPSVALERRPEGLPIEAGLQRDVAQREHHAFFHRLEAADVEIGVRIGDQRGEIGRPLAHQVLHVALGLVGRAAEGEVDVDEVLGQIAERPEIRQLLLGAGAEEQHQLAALEFARLAQAAPPLGHRSHRRASGAGADHHDRALRMVGHQEAQAERPGHLDFVADVEVAEIVADDSARRAALVILQHPLHGERDVVVARPFAVARARDRILPRVMRSPVCTDAGREYTDRLPFEHREWHRRRNRARCDGCRSPCLLPSPARCRQPTRLPIASPPSGRRDWRKDFAADHGGITAA